MTGYIWAGIAIVILFLLVRLMKWINGPRIEAAKTERKEARFDYRKWRRSTSRWFSRRKPQDNPETEMPELPK